MDMVNATANTSIDISTTSVAAVVTAAIYADLAAATGTDIVTDATNANAAVINTPDTAAAAVTADVDNVVATAAAAVAAAAAVDNGASTVEAAAAASTAISAVTADAVAVGPSTLNSDAAIAAANATDTASAAGATGDYDSAVYDAMAAATPAIPATASAAELEQQPCEPQEAPMEQAVVGSPIFKTTRGLLYMDKIKWSGDRKPSVQCERPRSESDDPPMLANSVRGAMTVESFGAVAEVARQVQDANDTTTNLSYGEKTCFCTCPCLCPGSEPFTVDKSKFKDWGDEFKGFNTIVVSDVSVQTVRESEQPTNDSVRNLIKKYLLKET